MIALPAAYAAGNVRFKQSYSREFLMGNYTCLLRCADGSLYCGWTNDPVKRLSAHNAGTAPKYTRARLPASMAYAEESDNRQEALRRECEKRTKRSADPV